MRKLIFSIITIMMLASVSLLAQNEQRAKVDDDTMEEETLLVNRRLSFNIVADSGYVSSLDQKNLWDGNEIAFGAGYSQNFSKAPWLTFGMSAAFYVQQNHYWSGSNWEGSNNGAGYGGQSASDTGSLASYIGNVLVGMGLSFNGNYFGLTGFSANVGIDTRARSNFRLSYRWWQSKNGKHSSTVGFAGEIYVVPLANTGSDYDDPDYISKPINLLWVQANYAYRINSVWSTDVVAYFRTGGFGAGIYRNGYNESSGLTPWEWTTVNTTLRLGWNIRATIDRLAFWAGIRCTMYAFTSPAVPAEDRLYQTVLRAGISYSFDISKL